MNNFTYSIPTEIHFGKGQISHLGEETARLGKRALLVYGGGSIHRSGLYGTVMAQLSSHGVTVFELSGVQPNPKITSVREGVALCRKEHTDVVVAVGGGSAIDCAKIIAAGAVCGTDPWELVRDGGKITCALPVVTVLTLSATGTEMDPFAVITDMETHQKLGTGSEFIKPRVSILDPTYTFSVPAGQTAAGTVDMMSHVFENYFTNASGAFVQARFCESLLKTCIHYGPIALDTPDDYEARSNLMWTSSLAINGLLSYGADVAWSVHPIEHELSAFYDITHGVGLAILTPCWMEYILSQGKAQALADYGVNVWGLPSPLPLEETAERAIQKTRDFFRSLGMPSTLRQVGIDSAYFEQMAEKAVAAGGLEDAFVPLAPGDVRKILQMAL